MSKVYIVQEPLRKNRDTGELERAFDFRPAAAYGDVEVLLTQDSITLMPAPMIAQLKRKLNGFTHEDYIVPSGDPSAIMAAGIIAAKASGGVVNVLKWNKQTQSYIKVTLTI